MSFQKVVKRLKKERIEQESFRTVSFQKVVKRARGTHSIELSFRTVSFQKVVKQGFTSEKSGDWF